MKNQGNNHKTIDFQKFLDFMCFQEYRAYTQEMNTMNVVNEGESGFPHEPIPYPQWLKENDLLED
tara:strand:- start:928 stop:1122 length:195 start_codon:yes stop_codon:yes gene_type:complete